MDVSNNEYPSTSSPYLLDPAGYDNSAMDVDMDIDLGADLELTALEAEAMNLELPLSTAEPTTTNGAMHSQTSGDGIQQEKVHIRGLDNLTTEDIKSFATEYFAPEVVRIEWIDDTSANIVYETSDLSYQALASFTDVSDPYAAELEPLHIRKAKKLPTHPHVDLEVRIATTTDIKKPRARDASRFYLMNPDKDPRERRREFDNRRNGRSGYGDRRTTKRLRDEEKEIPFDVNMYDDDPESLAARQSSGPGRERGVSRTSTTSEEGRRARNDGRNGDRREHELFERRGTRNGDGRLRDRSASPIRDGDGRLGFEEDDSRVRLIRQRSSTPPYRTSRNTTASNAGKELMGSAAASQPSILQPSIAATNNRELFPNRSSPMKKDAPPKELFPRELFPNKSPSNHRRKAAFDAADETGDLFANRMPTPSLLNGSSEHHPRPRSRNLADRITGGPPAELSLTSSSSRKADMEDSAPGFSIRGTAPKDNPGFSIRGAAAAGLDNPRVRELFPDRRAEGSNEGKELFSGKVKGRGGQRTKASDLFF